MGGELLIPAAYSSDLTWKQKVLFILNELGEAYVEDVEKRILELDSNVSKERAHDVATNMLSRLYRNKQIKAETRGRRYKYYI